MIKTIVQNDQSQKNGEIGEILRRPEEEEKKVGLELLLGRKLKMIL